MWRIKIQLYFFGNNQKIKKLMVYGRSFIAKAFPERFLILSLSLTPT